MARDTTQRLRRRTASSCPIVAAISDSPRNIQLHSCGGQQAWPIQNTAKVSRVWTTLNRWGHHDDHVRRCRARSRGVPHCIPDLASLQEVTDYATHLQLPPAQGWRHLVRPSWALPDVVLPLPRTHG